MLRLRSHVFICLGFFVALLVVGWGGALLAGLGIGPPPPAWRWALLGLMLLLLLGLAFSAVPVMVLLVSGAQGHLAAPRWQKTIVYVLWTLMAIGSAIAIPAAFVLGAFDQTGAGADIGSDHGPALGALVVKPGM
ncbi:MAG: hypothetical protein ABI588_06765 [Arenimonas sp.]